MVVDAERHGQPPRLPCYTGLLTRLNCEASERPVGAGPTGKITGYLLNTEHLYGASKARFFVEFGFRQEVWEDLAAALKEHGQRHEVASVRETEFGVRYAMDGVLRVPDNRQPRVRTI